MFTFGIFTTHIPYIAMVAFYAYFLIFGVEQPADVKSKHTEKSFIVQTHINNTSEIIPANTICFYSVFTEKTASSVFEQTKVRQKWRCFGADRFFPQDYPENTLFCRPPPVWA
ncbi:hypothetical protein [uncultured Draconibacterium sp.]|uniref:hypothetical protein n=1 Tax=uncultured Draconibacterium sp. TaxID=1573823 RepID=UPI00321729AF